MFLPVWLPINGLLHLKSVLHFVLGKKSSWFLGRLFEITGSKGTEDGYIASCFLKKFFFL